MIENHSRKSIRSIAWNIGVSEFLIMQGVNEDFLNFMYKMRKGQFLSQAMKDKSKDCTEKLLNKLKYLLKANMLWFFPKFLLRSDGELIKQPLACSGLTRCTVHIMVLEVVTSDGDIMLPFMASDSTWRPKSRAWKR